MPGFHIGTGRAAIAVDDVHYNYCRSHSPPSMSLEIRYCDNFDCLTRQRGAEDQYEVSRVYLAIRTYSIVAIDTAAVAVAAPVAAAVNLDCDAAQ